MIHTIIQTCTLIFSWDQKSIFFSISTAVNWQYIAQYMKLGHNTNTHVQHQVELSFSFYLQYFMVCNCSYLITLWCQECNALLLMCHHVCLSCYISIFFYFSGRHPHYRQSAKTAKRIKELKFLTWSDIWCQECNATFKGLTTLFICHCTWWSSYFYLRWAKLNDNRHVVQHFQYRFVFLFHESEFVS